MAHLENLSSVEKERIIELRIRMKDDLTLVTNEDDLFFYRFLKARDFDINKAESMLKKHIIFRKAMRLGTMLQDFKPKEVYLKYIKGSYIGDDKEGFPVHYLPFGKMDTRDIIKSFKFFNYFEHWIWTAEGYLAQLKEKSEKTGRNISKLIFIIDLENLALAVALHPTSAVHVIKIAEGYQDNYPETLKAIFVINAPPFYVFVFSILKPVLAAQVLQKLHIFGKTGWKEELLKVIDVDVLPAFLGGYRTDPDGNPMCETFVSHAGKIPPKYYLTKEDRSFQDKSRVKYVSIPPGGNHEVIVDVKVAGSVIYWEYEVKSRDIGFGLYFRGSEKEYKEILPIFRFETPDGTMSKSYKCQLSGTYVVLFDNKYSWLHTKEVSYCISVMESEELFSEDNLQNKNILNFVGEQECRKLFPHQGNFSITRKTEKL